MLDVSPDARRSFEADSEVRSVESARLRCKGMVSGETSE